MQGSCRGLSALKCHLNAFGQCAGAHRLGVEHDVVKARCVHLFPDLEQVAVDALHQAIERQRMLRLGKPWERSSGPKSADSQSLEPHWTLNLAAA